ncbi:MAG: hypothetical protein RLZ98_1142 [Pseudomonadota bacterium]|jgi:cellulose biosynthesis protein BcsQ
MAYFLAVANRKGGVGKSTIAVMLAHAFAVWGGKRVLVLDLDSQCNASLILIGGQGWSLARREERTIADYFYDLFDEKNPKAKEYVQHRVGDVQGLDGKRPRISLLPGSLLLEDVQGELFLMDSNQSRDHEVVGQRVQGKLERLLRRFGEQFDLVILDCPPGLSFAALAALRVADKVVVPFRPDYVSQFAVDRIAQLIENKRTNDAVEEIPFDRRRYVCLANFVRNQDRDRSLIDEIALFHPLLATQLPQREAIANALDWVAEPQPIEKKYGEATTDLSRLYEELATHFVHAQAAE